MTDQTTDEDFLPLSPDFLREHFPVAPSQRRENREVFAAFLNADRLRDDAAFYAALARMVTFEEGIEALRTYDRRMKAKGDDKKAFALRALRWLRNQNPGLDPSAILKRDPEELPPLSEERAVQALLLRLAAPAGAKADDKDASPDGAAPSVALSEPDWKTLARALAETAAALDHPDATVAERILALAEQLATACRTAAEAAAATEALARRAEVLRGRLTTAAPALAEAWPAEIDGAFLDALEASLDALETAIAKGNLAEDRRQKLDEQARAANDAGDLDEEEDLIPRRRVARVESEAAKAAVMGARQGLETLLQGTRTLPAEEDAAEEWNLTGGTSKPSDGTTDPEAPADTEPKPGQEINEPEETAGTKTGASASSETTPASDNGVPPSQAPQSDATTVPEDVHTPPLDDGPKAPQIPDSLSDATLLHWLRAGEIALAFHAARLAEQQGAQAALPPAALRGLALLRDIRRAEDMADPARTDAMAEMMGSLDGAPPVAARVAFAALLRPALFDPDHGARAHLRSLSADEALVPYAAVINALVALSHEVRLSVRRLAELGGRQVGPAAPQALEALRHWWTDAQKRTCMHQPTYRILHEDLHPSGHIGRIIQAVLAGAPNAEDEARSFIESLRDDRAAQEAFVEEAERRNGRPRRDRIEGMALTWFCERLQEACDHLSYWLEAQAQDRATPGDSQRQRLLAALGPLRKAMQQRQSADPALLSGEPDLDAAITALVNRELDALDRLLSGEVSSGLLPAPEEALEGPLLRLPGGCQDWTGGDPALNKERDARDHRLAEALADPAALSPDWDAALSARRAEGAILAARAVLRRREAAGLAEAEAAVRRQEIDEALTSARRPR